MTATPYLRIDLDAIEHNARAIVALCSRYGIAVSGVTKCVCGHPEIAQAMLSGGVVSIADSRLENIHRLSGAGVRVPYMLLRVPPLSAVTEVVAAVDVSLNSELAVLRALAAVAEARGLVHDVILMVDLGDLREGIWPDDLIPFVREAVKLRGVRLKGLGTNLACFAGVVPSEENMGRLVELARDVEGECAVGLEVISGFNSSGLELIASGRAPRRVNHARIGEAILLGRETTRRWPWPQTRQDAFTLHAEVLELKRKPSSPIGARAENAYGEEPRFQDSGEIARALLNVGREDVDLTGIAPLDSRLLVLGASSGYLVLDVSTAETEVHVGDVLGFSVKYGALLAAMTSQYVKKRLIRGGIDRGEHS